MTHFKYLFIAFLFFLPFKAQSQDPTANPVPEHPISPILKEMSYEGKIKVIDYIRYITQNIDEEIQYSFDRLNEENRAKVVQFIYAERTENGVALRTNVQWTQDTVDIGDVPEGNIVNGRFGVKNEGPNPYLIFEASSPCECTVLSHSIYPVIEGESTSIQFRFNSKDRVGDFILPVFIYDNSRPNTRMILYLKGNVLKR